MNVGFFTVFRHDPQHYVHAQGLIKSVRSSMPGVQVTQMTDETSPAVLGVDHLVRREHGPMLERIMEHYADRVGDWLLVDTDVQLLQDVRSVFEDTAFDVALCDRDWPHLPQTADVLRTMPFNTGVAFSRCSAFWLCALEIWRALPTDKRDWLSMQVAVYQAARTGRFRVKILPGMIYNYPPSGPKDKLSGVAIAHYKGPRKEWLPQKAA